MRERLRYRIVPEAFFCVKSGTRAIWLQLPGSNAAVAPEVEINVNGGELEAQQAGDYKLAIYSYTYGNSFENTTINVSGGILDGDLALTGGANKNPVETVNVTGGTIRDLYSYGDDALAADAISITGGVFESNYAELYSLDDGYVFELNSDGAYDVVPECVNTHLVINKVNEVKPTCTSEGCKAHYVCAKCGEKFSDAAGTTKVTDESLVIPRRALEKVEAKPATYTAEGNKEYYVCTECGKMFWDAEGTKEITDAKSVVIPKLVKESEGVKTGEEKNYNALIAFAILQLSAMCAVVVTHKIKSRKCE